MSKTERARDSRAPVITGASALLLAAALGLLMRLAWRLSDLLHLLFGAVIVAVALGAAAASPARRLRLSQRAAVGVTVAQIEGNLLMPWVQRWAVELPPALGITAAVIFGLLFGLPGIILATPLTVVAMVLVQTLYVEGLLERDVRQ